MKRCRKTSFLNIKIIGKYIVVKKIIKVQCFSLNFYYVLNEKFLNQIDRT